MANLCLPMPVALIDRAHTTHPARKRSPTQHMHNCSLHSPSSFGPRPTTPLPTRCQSSSILSEFRKAIYIPHTIRDAIDIPVDDGSSRGGHVNNCGRIARPTEPGGIPDVLRDVASDSAISLLGYMNDEEPSVVAPMLSSVISRRNANINPSPSFIPLTPPPTPTTGTYPPRPAKLNRLSGGSLASLPCPLPTPPGLTADAEWDIDPFASPFYSSARTTTDAQSKWSPTSSALSLAHQGNSSLTAPRKEHSAFEKLKGDIPLSPTKLKDFFGRLSISRNPTPSGFRFRGASKQRRSSRIVDEDKTNQSAFPVENTMSTHWRNDRADNCGDLPDYAVSHAFQVEQQGDIDWNDVHSPTSVSEFSPANSQASSRKCVDVDGIVAEHSTISDSTQFPLPAPCLHVSPSCTMRAPVPDVARSVRLPSPLSSPGKSSSTPAKPDSEPSRALAIPPSPRVQAPNLPPPYDLESMDNPLGMGFPSPIILSRYSSPASSSSEGETRMVRDIHSIPPSPCTGPPPDPPSSLEILSLPRQNYPSSGLNEITPPPALPPRSRLRPPPVKITTNFSQTREAIREDSEERNDWPLEITSISHSRSASIASLTISPLSTPPMHSQSSAGSLKGCQMPTPLHHSHSSSVASSLMISPMPTPPPLSPTSPLSSSAPVFPPLPLPRVLPVTPELDMRALRALILQRAGRAASRCGSEREVGESLEAIALARKRGDSDAHEASSTPTVMTPSPEFAWEEEPRPPPSRLSFYESAVPIFSDSGEERDDAASIFSQFSTAYTFRSRPNSSMRMRPLRRNGSTGRAGRRTAATSMMSVYSQASLSSQDVPLPSLPCSLRGDPIGEAEGTIAEHELSEMILMEAKYAYAYSLDDYVGHGMEGAALASRPTARSGGDCETQVPLTPGRTTGLSDDWRASLVAQDTNGVAKRRTSSNISVVGSALGPDIDLEVTSNFAFADVGSVATNGSVGVISTTSTSMPMSPVATGNSPVKLAPNRRQRTIRRVAMTSPPSSPRSNYQPPSSTFVYDTEAGNGVRRREMSSKEPVPFPSIVPEPYLVPEAKRTRGMRSGLQGMRSRVSVLKSRLVSLTLAPRSPSSPGRCAELKHHHPGLNTHLPSISPSVHAHSPTPVSPSISSSSSGGSLSTTPSSGSSWTPGLTTADGLFLSPIAAPSTAPMAI